MNRRSLLAVALCTAALGLVGCGPRWRIVAQAVPDPFLNQRRFSVLPIDFTGLYVGNKSEAEYLSGKEPEAQQSFIEDKRAMNEQYLQALIAAAGEAGIEVVPATGPASAPFMIRPMIGFLEGGFYTYVANASSQVDMTVRITAPDGQVLDEIAMTHRTAATITNPSSGGRLRDDAEALGEITAKYLRTRVAP